VLLSRSSKIAVALAAGMGVGAASPVTIFEEPFAQFDAARWREIEVKGRTEYAVEMLEGVSCLRAYSHSGASIVLARSRFHPRAYPWLSWKWRVDRFVDGENLGRKDGSDASARVYVYFDTPGLPWQKRSLDYVWSTALPAGTILESAYSKASKIIVVESGAASQGQWRWAVRNIEDDYRRCFGHNPPDAVSIGLMVDTDNTRSEALAYFDDIRVSREHP